MKKLFFFICLLFAVSIPVIADDGGSGSSPPSLFASLSLFVPATVVVTQFILRFVHVEKWKQGVSWAVAIVLSVIGFLLRAGMFAELTLVHAVLYGAAGGLAANGVFDIPFIQKLLDTYLPKKKAYT
ncbi:hypothetical protein LLG07_04775 [bacterium]|nr:hypothetical protein [bacterium]